jgi:hypothetical protein
MGVTIKSGCRAGESVQISYSAYQTTATLNDQGIVTTIVDLFDGLGKSVTVTFSDNTRRIVTPKAVDLDRLIKVALIWEAPVELNLHVFEYATAAGTPGNISAMTPSSYAEAKALSVADGRAHGFMSTMDGKAASGTHVQVYTLLRNATQTNGAIAMALDYTTRGDKPSGQYCGNARYGSVEYRFSVLDQNGKPYYGIGTLRALPCGVALPAAERYLQAGLPVLRILGN